MTVVVLLEAQPQQESSCRWLVQEVTLENSKVGFHEYGVCCIPYRRFEENISKSDNHQMELNLIFRMKMALQIPCHRLSSLKESI